MNQKFDYIAPPVARDKLLSELNANTFVRKTNKGQNDIYVIDAKNGPNVLLEIGRLRELTFASAGGGTGLEYDLDEYDSSENCYKQLIVFSPEDNEIVGGYRYIDCSKIMDIDPLPLSTKHYFNFSEKFINEYLPFTIELGRSWVQPAFQPSNNSRKGMFALDNLWDGLGAITIDNPHIKHFFGKVTMYPHYNREARDAVLAFMDFHFNDIDKLVEPLHALKLETDLTEFLNELGNCDYKVGYRLLQRFARDRGEVVPPLVNAYMSLSSSMKSFGTAVNKDFGGVEETGILVTINDIYEDKKDRHVASYSKQQ